jgi:hypothetical protein
VERLLLLRLLLVRYTAWDLFRPRDLLRWPWAGLRSEDLLRWPWAGLRSEDLQDHQFPGQGVRD